MGTTLLIALAILAYAALREPLSDSEFEPAATATAEPSVA